MLEINFPWTLTSTGAAATACDGAGLRWAQQLTFSVACQAPADTCSFGIEAAPQNSTLFTRMGSTLYSVSSGACAIVQLTGPLQQVRPYLISRTASTSIVTVQLDGTSGA